MTKRFFFFLILLFGVGFAGAQTVSPEEYIETYKDLAVREMKRMGVPAAITLAQGLLETESGNSVLLKKSNNHFGIKCKSSWTGGGVSHDDDAIGECFRTYKDAEESYRDHSNFLRGNGRYAFLFDLNPNDYKGWAHGLKKAGYATNPRYPAILIKYIETYNLQQYSDLAAADVPKFDASKYEDDKEIPMAQILKESEEKEASQKLVSPASVNGIKCIVGEKGTSLLAIATQQNIQLNKLLEYNDFEKDGILEKDQLVFLEKKAKVGDRAFHIAQNKETLADVAQSYGVQFVMIQAYNPGVGNEILKPGQKIALQPVTTATNGTANATVSALQGKIHEVQPKEGLYSISKKYGVTIQQIKEWNGLNSDNLSIGQKLIVSK